MSLGLKFYIWTYFSQRILIPLTIFTSTGECSSIFILILQATLGIVKLYVLHVSINATITLLLITNHILMVLTLGFPNMMFIKILTSLFSFKRLDKSIRFPILISSSSSTFSIKNNLNSHTYNLTPPLVTLKT